MAPEIFNIRELRRYSHHIAHSKIGLKGQEKIKQTKVMVVGAGSKGTAVLQNLTAIGIGEIGINDDCIIDEKDLISQHLYGNSDVGKQKAIITKQKLQEINHFVHFKIYNILLNKKNILKLFKDYDIIVDTSGILSTSYLINDAVILLNKPLVYGSIADNLGKIAVFNYNNKSSLRCLYPNILEAESKNSDTAVIQVFLSNITGCIMANEVIKIVLGDANKVLDKLLTFNISDYSIQLTPIIKNPKN